MLGIGLELQSGAKKASQSPKIARTALKNYWTIRGGYRSLPSQTMVWGKSHQKVQPNVRQNLCHRVSLWYLFCLQFRAQTEKYRRIELWFFSIAPCTSIKARGPTLLEEANSCLKPKCQMSVWSSGWCKGAECFMFVALQRELRRLLSIVSAKLIRDVAGEQSWDSGGLTLKALVSSNEEVRPTFLPAFSEVSWICLLFCLGSAGKVEQKALNLLV